MPTEPRIWTDDQGRKLNPVQLIELSLRQAGTAESPAPATAPAAVPTHVSPLAFAGQPSRAGNRVSGTQLIAEHLRRQVATEGVRDFDKAALARYAPELLNGPARRSA